MEFNPNAPIIVVAVELSGERGSRVADMALDTGATYVMIPWRLAEALGYDPAVSRRRVNIITASSAEVAPLITGRSMKALDQEVNDVDVVCHDLPPGSRIRRLLGLSFLKHFDMDVHFKRKILELRDP